MAKYPPSIRIGIIKYDNPRMSSLKKGDIVQTSEYYKLFRLYKTNNRSWYLEPEEDVDFREFTALEKVIYGIE